MEIGIVLALFFGGLGIAIGGYSLEQNHHRVAVLSYVFGGGCVAAAIVLATLLLDPGILQARANNPDWSAFKYADVWGQHFANQTVRLDGKFFHNCTFDGVTFEYDGTGPFQFDPPVPLITNTKVGQTNNSIVKATFNLFHYLAGVKLENRPQ